MRRWWPGLVILLMIAGGAFFVSVGIGHTRRAVMYWCADALEEALDDHLAPAVAFDGLAYTWPSSLTMTGVTLRDDDVTVARAASVTVSLAEVPRIGRPFIVDAVEVTGLAVNLVEGPDGGWRGFAPLLRDDTAARDPLPPGALTDKPPASDLFALRRLRIEDATVTVQRGEERWRLDELGLDVTGGPEAGGWYRFATDFGRAPLALGRAEGRVQIDTGDVELDRFTLSAAMAADEHDLLPAPLGPWARDHGLRGRVEVDARGRFPGADWTAGALDVALRMSDLACGLDGVWLPVESAEATVTLDGGDLRIDPAVVTGAGGQVAIRATLVPRGDWPLDATIDAEGIRLEALLGGDGAPSDRYRGRIGGAGTVTGSTRVLEAICAEGRIRIDEGRLLEVPIVAGLARAMDTVLNPNAADRDRAEAAWRWADDTLTVEGLRVVSATIAARGAGTLSRDGQLDLVLNAGPLERVQDGLGDLGALFGAITDALIKYRVTGPAGDPRIDVHPLGVGAEAAR